MVNRGKPATVNRFSNAAASNAASFVQPPSSIGELRAFERSEVSQFNDPAVYLPNPTAEPPFDRHHPQPYEAKVKGLGLAPNIPQHFWQLEKGDAGGGSSIYRTTEIFQRLAPLPNRVAATPYSKAIQIATEKSRDNRPRYFHASMFSIARQFSATIAPGPSPAPSNLITEFAAGIPAGTPSVGAAVTQFGVPSVGTSKFRIMVFDESGQRFFDVDVIGTRSVTVYGWGVTVFALIKEDGYEIDRQVINPPLGTGLLEQSIVGSRIIPLMRNRTGNISNRTVTLRMTGGSLQGTLPIPPGARTAQIYSIDGAAGTVGYTLQFATINLLDPTLGLRPDVGVIDFEPGIGRTSIYDVPNANAIRITGLAIAPPTSFVCVFEATS